MIVEVVAVGTELLLGQIVNTNAADIGTRLAEDGFDVHYQTTVGDNLDRLVDTIRTAAERADAVLLTGGIGPTQDDMTRDAICAVLGVGLATDEAHADAIRDRLAQRGVVADSALRMADYPAGSTPMPNRKGVALGIAALHGSTPIFAVPGVPTEMRVMVDEEVRPRLRAASGEPSVLRNRQLHCWGLGESQIAEQLADLYETTNPSIAFLINGPEVRVRITAKAATETEVDAMIAGVETEVRSRLGDAIFAVDDETIDGLVASLTGGRSLAVVEVATAGLLGARLASLPGFAGSTVLPTPERTSGEPASPQVLARKLLDRADRGSEIAIAVSDALGQRDGDGAAAREVGVAVRVGQKNTSSNLRVLGDDERVRRFAVPGALHLLRQALHAASD